MKAEVMRLREELETTYRFAEIVGSSAAMQRVYALIERTGKSAITVLILGGTSACRSAT